MAPLTWRQVGCRHSGYTVPWKEYQFSTAQNIGQNGSAPQPDAVESE